MSRPSAAFVEEPCDVRLLTHKENFTKHKELSKAWPTDIPCFWAVNLLPHCFLLVLMTICDIVETSGFFLCSHLQKFNISPCVQGLKTKTHTQARTHTHTQSNASVPVRRCLQPGGEDSVSSNNLVSVSQILALWVPPPPDFLCVSIFIRNKHINKAAAAETTTANGPAKLRALMRHCLMVRIQGNFQRFFPLTEPDENSDSAAARIGLFDSACWSRGE